MKSQDLLHLTYIPSLYWNNELSCFKVITKGPTPPKETSFLLVWTSSDYSKDVLNKRIHRIFPKIPVNKLITCEIRLALLDDNQEFRVLPIRGKVLPLSPAIKLLFQLDVSREDLSDSIKSWSLLIKFILELLNRGNFIPVLEKEKEKTYKGKWHITLKTQFDNDRFMNFVKLVHWSAINLPINFIIQKSKEKEQDFYTTDGLWHPSYVFHDFIDVVGNNIIKSQLMNKSFLIFKEIYGREEQISQRGESSDWDYRFLKSLIHPKFLFEIEKFHETIIPTIIKDWTQIDCLTSNIGLNITIKLEYPNKGEDEWGLGFYIQSIKSKKELIPLSDFWNEKKAKNKSILNLIKLNQDFYENVLRRIGVASKIFTPMSRILDHELPEDIMLTSSEVMALLRYPKDLLIQSGFNIILPEVFTQGGKQRFTARVVIKSGRKSKERGTSKTLPTLFDAGSLLEYRWEGILEGVKLTDSEFKELIESNEPLLKWRDQWVLIDPQDVQDLRNINKDQAITGKKSFIETIKLGLAKEIQLKENGNSYEVIVEGDLQEILDRLQTIEKIKEISIPKSFHGTLRPYQEDGLTWMGNLAPLGFGLCLADDMGLGKTIQVISLLLHLKEGYPEEKGSVLITCPTSVLFNWAREIKKFAPGLEVLIHHGSNRIKDPKKFSEFIKPHRIILTTFGTIRNDIDFLETIPFNAVIVDEIQNIKNFKSKQTKAILKLQGKFRIGLSGTPIENRLMELWTLFEFLNPGLLESKAEFQRNYVLPIERFQDEKAVNNLRNIIKPFILRRMKSDKSIISDLPEKNEMKVFVDLSPIQAKMYTELVESTLKEIEASSSDMRKKKGLVLKLLTQLKQICNHPCHYLKKTPSTFMDDKDIVYSSQKLERLFQMTEEVVSNGEKMLIFTQFKKMGDIIKFALEKLFNLDVLFFHGGVPEKKRRLIVDNFQSNAADSAPILVLSLKAGGTGLNLTKGTTVIHYDRWWNPAVEDQATDRAYRIGQKSQVNVYKFVAIGTIEEKIDKLLEEKRELADKIVSTSGESWISDFGDNNLRDLFQLESRENMNSLM